VAWDLNPTQRELASGLSQPNPFVWLFEVVVPSSPATMLRLAANTSDVNFGVNSDGDSIRYKRAAFTVSALSEGSDGKLPSIQVAAGNPTREIQALIEEYDGLIGQTAKLQLVNVGAIVDCDKSPDGPNGCRAHSNETRFGGFPGNPPSGAGL